MLKWFVTNDDQGDKDVSNVKHLLCIDSNTSVIVLTSMYMYL